MNKILTTLLILAISIQPLQANGCDMDSDQSSSEMTQSHHMSMSMGDGNTHGHDANSEAGQHGMPDCCNAESVNEQQSCEHALNCGNCYLSTSAISHLSRIAISWPVYFQPEITSGDILPSHDYPLFRPPIS